MKLRATDRVTLAEAEHRDGRVAVGDFQMAKRKA